MEAHRSRAAAHERQILILLAVTTLVTAGTILRASCHDPTSIPIPMNTSMLTGEAWTHELLTGHPEPALAAFRLETHVFVQLAAELHQ